MEYILKAKILLHTVLLAASLGLWAPLAQAATVTLTSAIQCSANNAVNGISESDVTGNMGGASDCWGTNNGNDSQQTGTGSGDGFIIDGMLYGFVSKKDIDENKITGADIGLTVGGTPSTSGTWAVDATKFAPYGDFLIVLKAANAPGYAVWLFEDGHSASTSGTWNVAWNKNLSHLTVYAKLAAVPVPAAFSLLLLALGALGAVSWRRRSA